VSRLACVVAFAALLGCGGGHGSSAPNVVVIVVDTARADRFSTDGYSRDTSPHLAQFAKDAVTFRDAWAPCCWTAPSHASLFTALRPEHHGLTEGVRPFLAPEATTLAERFQAAGWRTACFTNNEWISDRFGLTQGFDTVSELYLSTTRPYPWAPQTHRDALDWALKDDSGKPFFLFINDMEPHLPYTPSEASQRKFVSADVTPEELADARAFDFPFTVGYTLGRTEVVARKRKILSDLYDAEVADFDAALGSMLAEMADTHLLDHTIVVVTSDHGEALGEHRRMGHLFGMWRQNLRVPLVVRYPGAFDKGRVVTDCVRLEDIAPTLLELCGQPVPSGLDGKSLLADLPGRVARAVVGAKHPMVPDLEAKFPGADLTTVTTGMRSIHAGRWHYVRDSTGHEELYDVVADPDETKDLATSDVDALDRMRKTLGE
jgi:arylsulfatase A-like enzyme